MAHNGEIIMTGPITKQISDSVWQAGTWEFCQYLVGKTHFILIEGGVSPQAFLIKQQIASLNLGLDAVRYACILHSHFDHLGTIPFLTREKGALPIISGSKNIEILSNKRILKRMLASSKAITDSFMKKNFLPDIFDMKEMAPIPVDHPVKAGDTFGIDTLTLQFFELPGHSPDGIGAYLPEEGVFFASDMAGLFLPDGSTRSNYYFNLTDYEASLEKILSIDMDLLCLGHSGTLSGKKAITLFLEQSMDATQTLKKEIKKAFEARKDLDAMAQFFAKNATQGFLAFFPFEHNYMLSKLIIRRTLEYFDLPVDTAGIK